MGRYLDSGIELRGPLEEVRELLARRGYFLTTQGCNLSDQPDVPCDPQVLHLPSLLLRARC